uniref:replication initiation protein RepM n=1 Tax=Psychrobacter sp. TaxID=56811 RepID=UPI001599ED39|nr:replication initiation protein RepM [Psychrobacter sp.]QJS05815.1 DNA replication protein [Psychrobacter sp.]
MSKLIVKDNALINASYSLSLVEQRLVLLAILEARQNNKDGNYDKPIIITADSYVENFNVQRGTAYKVLQLACKSLFERRFSYQEKRGKGVANITSRWVSQIAYIENTATVELIFAPAVIPLVTELEKHFTKYELAQVAGLNSAYAVRLYEICIAWRKVGKVPQIELQELRNRLGVLDDEYPLMERFKAKVLLPALKQINKHTDITADYKQHKTGRKITAISFTFKQKPSAKTIATDKPTNADTFIKMTADQIATFSTKLAALPELGSNAPLGKSTLEFAAIIADHLADKTKQAQYLPYLDKLGFKKLKPKAA